MIGKSRRLEIRQLKLEEEDEEMMMMNSPFPIVLSIPINGRITSLKAIRLANYPTALLFLTTDQYQYAVIGYNANVPNYVETFDSGSLKDEWNVMGSMSECGPLLAVDPHNRCIALHLYDGLVSIFPLRTSISTTGTILGPVFHARLEERTILQITMLHHWDVEVPPHLCLLHQDARGAQHISTHVVDVPRSQLLTVTSMTGNQTSYDQKQIEWLKKSRIDGGSSLLIPVPPPASPVAAAASSSAPKQQPSSQSSGGVVILGQRQITFVAINHYKVMPIPPALLLSWDALPPDVSGMPRYLLGDEFGNLHMLTLITQNSKVAALQLDTLGSCTLSNTLTYLNHGLVFCGSTLGDSQLVQIHDEPIPVEALMEDDNALELGETTYLSVEEEYTHLGPIVDFDLVPMAGSNRTEGVQSQVVTASGSSKSGSLRVVQNGIGMKEYASVELSGIQNMWSLRQKFDDTQDAYLVQSFVGETRVLGVATVGMEVENPDGDAMMTDEEEVGGTLEEVVIPGLESNASTLFVTNVVGDLFLQVTETEIRLTDVSGLALDSFMPEHPMTVATGNEAGQVAVALRGGKVLYFDIQNEKLQQIASKQMDREVSCLDINPFLNQTATSISDKQVQKSDLCAVGLWDDFTVRLLSLENVELTEVLLIHLSTEDEDGQVDANTGEKRRSNRNNMMARSLCLSTLDVSSSSSNSRKSNNGAKSGKGPGVNMLFVGLGDGTLISFAVVQQDASIRVQSKKEVSLGTQRINLIPLHNERGGSCVLATGDRPTVIYLASASGANYNPKLCYSNVNLSPADDVDANDVSRPHAHESISVNVATPFFSPLLFDMSQEHYSLCVADDANLRLGIIDDIQKLHVSTYPLGMAPRRIVHCPEGRMIAVGCIESGIDQAGGGGGELNMGNCIRFLDDTTFNDIER